MPAAARVVPASSLAVAAAVAISVAAAPLAAQTPAGPSPFAPPPGEPVQVLVLGTYHFANPGLDVVKTEVADVLAPARQQEIESIVESLARFRPTKIAIEAPPSSRARFDSLLGAYRAGSHTLSRDERQQIGFRLASKMGLTRLHPIDEKGEFPFQQVMGYLQQKDTATLGWLQRAIGYVTAEENRMQREMGVTANLRKRNERESIAMAHQLYMRLAPIGAGDGFVGADLVSKWYDRNLRIFANLRAMAEPGDRIVVIYGAGHSAILRELVAASPGMKVVEALDYLPAK